MKYIPSVAQRLSGLSERSMGNGMSRASVVHARCQEDIKVGRVSRKAGEFLCRRWHPWDVSDYPDGKVTCPRCLTILSKINSEVA